MIRLNADCINCMLKRYLSCIPENLSETERLEYMQMICKKIADASKEDGAPVLVQAIKQEIKKDIRYRKISQKKSIILTV